MEIEIKYAPVSYAQFVAIADDFGLTGEEIVRMSANYFDTADGFLSENRISLRNRTENDVSVYTMKCSLRNEGGVAVRDHQGYTPSARRIIEQAGAEAEQAAESEAVPEESEA